MAEASNGKRDSFLLADIGTSNTTAILLDVVAGQVRLIGQARAPSTVHPPWSDLSLGLQNAIGRLAEITGRQLLTAEGALIRSRADQPAGVDAFGLSISAAPPLKTLVVGLLQDVSLRSARQALATTYTRVVDQYSLADDRDESARVEAFLRREPDLVLIAGGTDGGADRRLMQLVETVAAGISLTNGRRKPDVIYAGNRHLRPAVTEALGPLTNFLVADNVRPELENEQIGDAARVVQEVYEDRQMTTLPSFAEVEKWCQFPVLSTATAFAHLVGYFAALHRGPVLGVDLGSQNTVMVAATADGQHLAINPDLGLGEPLRGLLSRVRPDQINRYLPLEVRPSVIADFIFNKSLQPHTVPATDEDRALEQALARTVLVEAWQSACAQWHWTETDRPSPVMVVARGQALAEAPRPGQALLILLDALPLTGAFAVALDRHHVLPSLGVIAAQDPLAVVQTLAGNALPNLGWVIVPVGRARPGQKVLNVRLESGGGALEIDVEFGAIEVLPLASGVEADVHLEPLRRFDIGQGPGRARQLRITGGLLGLIIDARGRPIQLPDEAAERRAALRQWQWAVGG